MRHPTRVGWFRQHPGYDTLKQLFTELLAQAAHNVEGGGDVSIRSAHSEPEAADPASLVARVGGVDAADSKIAVAKVDCTCGTVSAISQLRTSLQDRRCRNLSRPQKWVALLDLIPGAEVLYCSCARTEMENCPVLGYAKL